MYEACATALLLPLNDEGVPTRIGRRSCFPYRVYEVSIVGVLGTRFSPSWGLCILQSFGLFSPMPTLLSAAAFAGWILLFPLLPVAASSRTAAISPRSTPASEARLQQWLDQHQDRPGVLRAFVQRMPKGGDIHSHLSGAVYAENYLNWAAADGFCVDPSGPSLVKARDCGREARFFPARELMLKPTIYSQFVNLWSTRNLPFVGRSGHDQFFDAFAGFDLISSSFSRQDDMVAEVANRAASQEVFYLELMLTMQGSAVRKLGQQMGWRGDFAQMRQRLLGLGLMELVAKGSRDMATLHREVAKTLACDTPRAQPGCAVMVRYLQQTVRTRPPEEVFAQFVYAFELAKQSAEVVGINLVAPEDNPIALRDYTVQMQMLQFLKALHPEVKISLHAGELTLGLVPPSDLRFHIRQAVELAQASRIGHGVAILYEEQPFQLMEEMRRRGVLVEICLTSNEVILNVAGKKHPFLDYWQAGVPLALASDDEGISRIDLSHEYLLALLRYRLRYRDLKILARNSLEYSFLDGQSLWVSPQYRSIQPACAEHSPGAAAVSSRCAQFLNASERARVQWQLEGRLAAFEALPSFQPRATRAPAAKGRFR